MGSRSLEAADGGGHPQARTETGDSSAGAGNRVFMNIPRLLGGSEIRIRDRLKEEKIPPPAHAGVCPRDGQKSFGQGAV